MFLQIISSFFHSCLCWLLQILRNAGVRTFVGGNLGTPLSDGVLQCLAFPAEDPPFSVNLV